MVVKRSRFGRWPSVHLAARRGRVNAFSHAVLEADPASSNRCSTGRPIGFIPPLSAPHRRDKRTAARHRPAGRRQRRKGWRASVDRSLMIRPFFLRSGYAPGYDQAGGNGRSCARSPSELTGGFLLDCHVRQEAEHRIGDPVVAVQVARRLADVDAGRLRIDA